MSGATASGHHHHHQRPPPLGPFNEMRKHSEQERWICIYPAYINSLKTRAQGRLLPKNQCVPDPTYLEIRDVLLAADAGWKPLVENKQYPRERSRELQFRGRIRVQLRNDDGSLFNDKFANRESIMRYLGEKIPQLKSRTSGGGRGGGGGGGGGSDGHQQQSKKGKRK